MAKIKIKQKLSYKAKNVIQDKNVLRDKNGDEVTGEPDEFLFCL